MHNAIVHPLVEIESVRVKKALSRPVHLEFTIRHQQNVEGSAGKQ